ncbi:RNA polymerase sigma-70 factor, ECF subfamily [bacterium A37T11]|nr:RNA polymerase sigma-70 factor, ECF subfamily [bacterium A37T11]
MATYHTFSDEQLLYLLSQGNEAAFSAIYNRYWSILLRHALRMLHNDEDEAQDILQDTFSMLWDRREMLEVHGKLSAFLYGTLRNRILNSLDHQKVRANYQASLGAFEASGPLMPDQALRDKELARLIEEEIQHLPSKMREIFELRSKEELSYREISEKLNVTEHTVRKQVSNALRILRDKLNKLGLLFAPTLKKFHFLLTLFPFSAYFLL